MALTTDIDGITVRDRSVAGPTPDGGPSASGSAGGKGAEDLSQLTGAVDIIALEALATDGIVVRTGAAGWTTRAITLDSSLSGLLSLTYGGGVSGNPTFAMPNRAANTMLAGPSSGADATPAFRALVAADIPDLSTTYQPRDSDLDALAALTTDAFGRSLLELASDDTVTFGALKTAAPSVGTAVEWKLGGYDATVPTIEGRVLVEIGGTNYYLAALLADISAPTELSGLEIWLDASDSSTLFDATTGGSAVAADGAVARWEDKSGNANHYTQATGASQPLRKTAVQNSLDAVLFDGSNDYMSRAAVVTGTDWSVFAVYKLTTNSAAQFVYMEGNSSSSGFAIVCNPSNNRQLNHNGVGAWTDGAQPSTWEARSTTRANPDYPEMWVDGSSQALTPPGTKTYTIASGNSVIGGTQSGTAPLNGYLGELFVYSRKLSSAERAACENYMKAKWATP